MYYARQESNLKRTDQVTSVMMSHLTEQGYNFSSYRLVYPIPQREIDVSYGILTQNKGY
ncbi:hypothetical protein [Flavivirga sp. 57AJ16]|uniref:hypothetical protein n=1 Tax=Flavivirga sp. 57AJ16 TaxID=3025307 RepID=UPI002365B02B|nr:hypothetical protein [Flavivirga sp. 57AJ16]MDD7887528.1 hypothetical protein [Flavivirga sp. 57AJ16]